MGGPGITDAKVLSKAGSDTPSEYTFVFTDTRRSIYTPAFRNRRLELFEVFDAANPNAVVGRRPVSTVAPQALYLLNSPFVMEQAAVAAQHLLEHSPDDVAAQIDHAFQQTLSRRPTATEREAVLTAVNTNTADPLHAWTTVYQSLFGCIDFRTLE
jgi:thioredoxin-like negative regulator of GroEL